MNTQVNNWQSEIKLPEKPSDFEYGYIFKNSTEPSMCDEETLLELIEKDDDIELVTTPSHDSFIIPGSDYFTLQPILRKRKAQIKSNFRIACGMTAIYLGFMLLGYFLWDEGFWSDRTVKLNLLIFGVLPMLNSFYELFALNKVNEDNYLNETIELQFSYWLNKKKVFSIYIITAIIAFITLSQFITGFSDSVEIAGLVKPNAIANEYWRILTGPLLHGSVIHILFNSLAIFIIGRMVIRVTDLEMFSVVLLFSMITGSLFSILFMPNQTSVGISGGIMGLIGFLLTISLKQRKLVPRNILKSMVNSIVLIAIMGLAATDIIDNAAHGGGLLGGIIVGVLLIRSRKESIPYKSGWFVSILGYLSIALLLYGVFFVLMLLY